MLQSSRWNRYVAVHQKAMFPLFYKSSLAAGFKIREWKLHNGLEDDKCAHAFRLCKLNQIITHLQISKKFIVYDVLK